MWRVIHWYETPQQSYFSMILCSSVPWRGWSVATISPEFESSETEQPSTISWSAHLLKPYFLIISSKIIFKYFILEIKLEIVLHIEIFKSRIKSWVVRHWIISSVSLCRSQWLVQVLSFALQYFCNSFTSASLSWSGWCKSLSVCDVLVYCIRDRLAPKLSLHYIKPVSKPQRAPVLATGLVTHSLPGLLNMLHSLPARLEQENRNKHHQPLSINCLETIII